MNTVRKYKKKYVSKRLVRRTRKYGSRVPRPLTQDSVTIKCEYQEGIMIPNGGITYTFTSLQTFVNLYTVLANSVSWTNLSPEYGKFKVTGVSLTASRCFSEGEIDTNLAGEVSATYVAFYPQATSTSLGSAPFANDNNMMIAPYNSIPVSKYWKFPANFFESGGMGLGMWCNVQTASALTGQFSVYGTQLSTTATAATYVHDLRFTVYVQLSLRNR